MFYSFGVLKQIVVGFWVLGCGFWVLGLGLLISRAFY